MLISYLERLTKELSKDIAGIKGEMFSVHVPANKIDRQHAHTCQTRKPFEAREDFY
jgi:hypothetical protein